MVGRFFRALFQYLGKLMCHVFEWVLPYITQAITWLLSIIPDIPIDPAPFVGYYQFVNAFFPLTECFGFLSAYVTFRVGLFTTRFILKCIPAVNQG